MKSFLSLALLILLGALLSGAAEDPQPPMRGGAVGELAASLTSPSNIELRWTNNTSDVAGRIVEWATDPQGEYVTLAFLAPRLNTFVHSDLPLDTPCYYRVRPYLGPASDPVEITTGKAPADDAVVSFDETWADPKKTSGGSSATQHSIRSASSAAAASPAGLTAKLIHPTGIQFNWTDRASDEDGYMLEIKLDEEPEFRVCALIDADVTSYGYAVVPPETKATFRVRAYYYGKPSNVDGKTTGAPRVPMMLKKQAGGVSS
jgi:hypothetical protein